MSDEIINKIIESLYEGTIAGAVVWSLRNTNFNSEVNHNLSTFSIDKDTEFRIEISLDELNFSPGSYLYIHNEKISGGYKGVSSYKNTALSDLERLVYTKFILPNVKKKLISEEDLLVDILNSIGSREYVRDKKLEQILGSESKQEERVTKIEDIETKKKWSLW